MDSAKQNSLRDNPHFEILGTHYGRIICLTKRNGAMLTLNPQSNSVLLNLAPLDWWIAKGWRRVTQGGRLMPHWINGAADICEYAMVRGQIKRKLVNELIRQRARRRYEKLRAFYDDDDDDGHDNAA